MNLTINSGYNQNFSGNKPKRAAKNVGELMTILYKKAYGNSIPSQSPDIILISAKMSDGKEVTAIADFFNGKYIGLNFPYELAHYRLEFCKNILQKYNTIITKGKSNRH